MRVQCEVNEYRYHYSGGKPIRFSNKDTPLVEYCETHFSAIMGEFDFSQEFTHGF